MQNQHSVAGHWEADFNESAFQAWVEELRRKLGAEKVSLGLVFIAPRFFRHAAQALEILRVHGQVPLLAGCSSGSVIAGAEEVEGKAGMAVALYALPGAELKAFHFTQADAAAASADANHWERRSGLGATDTNGWLVFADPFRLDSEAWLDSWNAAFAPLPVMGGLASGDHNAQFTPAFQKTLRRLYDFRGYCRAGPRGGNGARAG